MGIFELYLHAFTENISEIKLYEPESYEWVFEIECTQCHSVQPNEIVFSLSDTIEMLKGGNTVNFTMNCKSCKKGISIVTNPKSLFSIKCLQGNDEGLLCSFECRGCDLLKWNPREIGWAVVATETEREFKDTNIFEMWMEYDEKSETTLNILEPVTFSIKKTK